MGTTRLQMVDRARQKVHMESSSFVDTCAPLFVQEAYNEVYNLYAAKGMHMTEVDYSPTINGSTSYDLPAAVMSILNVYKTVGTEVIPLQRAQPDDEASIRSSIGSEAEYYKIKVGTTGAAYLKKLFLYPNPTSGTITVQYVPVAPTLSGDTTELITIGDSDALVACILAKKFLGREDEMNKEIDDEFKRLYDEFQAQVERIEMLQPATIQDTRNKHYDSFNFRVALDDY